MTDDIFASGILTGQHALITGGGSGINFRIAQRFAAQGAKVSIIGRSLEKSQAAARDIEQGGGQAEGFSADVREFGMIATAVEDACARFGDLDIVVAGAAGNFVAEAAGMSANGFKTVIDIDLLGTYNTLRAAYARLRRPGASLLAISAVQSMMPTAGQAHVCAAKAGIDMLVRCLSVEWGAEGIRCNAIAPGPVAGTEGMVRLAPEGDASMARILEGIPMQRYASRDEIADLALFLVSGAASYINGTCISIDGGQSNLGSLPFGAMLQESLHRSRNEETSVVTA
ncbi:MAG: SDR family oxidoreductase [Methylococcaceae bacterium]|nr:SDR family oxidoreductase [Methylococcaceae bacterium]